MVVAVILGDPDGSPEFPISFTIELVGPNENGWLAGMK